MPENRKQHVVPRFYLGYFCDDKGWVYVLDRPSGKTLVKRPHDVGIESECYTVAEGGVRDMSADDVNKGVENFCGKPLGALAASVAPSAYQWQAIWFLTANLLTRSRHVRDQLNDSIRNLKRRLGENGGWGFLAQQDPTLADAEAVFDRATKVSHAAVVGAGLQPTLEEIKSKPCQLLVAPANARFITSDDPVLVLDDGAPAAWSHSPGFLKAESISLFLPLKHNLACRWGDGPTLSSRSLSVDEIKRYNSLVCSRAYRQAYSADATDFLGCR